MTNIRKTLIMNKIMSQKYYLNSIILIQYIFRLLNNENIIIISTIGKIVALICVPHSILTFRDCMWGNIRRSPLKSPIIAHRHLCLEMFEGEYLISILEIWV